MGCIIVYEHFSLSLLIDAIFFDMDPHRTDTDKLARRDEALSAMLRFLPGE